MGMKARNWNGMTITEKIDRAAGRAIVGIAMQAAVNAKQVTHVVSGNLRRSIHAAPSRYDGGPDDERLAATADLMLVNGPPPPTMTPLGPAVEVGSWMPYACVEWVGRMHPGITQGVEQVRGMQAENIVAVAFREEGL